MFDWLNNIMNSWQMIFVYGLTDYIGDAFTRPLLDRGGMVGSYINSGLVFAAKQAAAQTSYFTSMGGSITGYFGKK